MTKSTPEITAEKLTGNPADKIEQWSIDKLIPYARNSRTHSDEQVGQIAASIKEWGWTTPILVDENGGIIAGHGRTMAAQRLKMTTVPVMVATGWSEAKKRAYIIADNRPCPERPGGDNEMLATEFKDLMEFGFDVSLTGFTEEEIDALMPLELEEGLTDPDDTPEVPVNPVTVQGDVWVMGKHRLLCGDSTSMDDLAKLCENQLVDMWLTDPPYNVAYEGGTKEKLTIQNDSMGDDQFRQFLRDAYTAADSVMKPGAVFLHLARRLRGLQLPRRCQGCRLDRAPVPDLEKVIPRHGSPGLPLETRALPLRLERRRRPPLGRRPQADHHPRVRQTHPQR